MRILAKLPGTTHRRRRRRRLKSLALAPTLMTLGNLLCGFAAIHFALRAMYDFGAGVARPEAESLTHSLRELTPPSFLSVGAGLVIAGMVFDMLDGLIARVTRSTTNFGGQLDSLADMVTFGVAPATLMVAFMTQELAGESILPSPISEHFLGRATWVVAAVYVAFTAVRLARYNVEHDKADFDFQTFRGIPSPAAAVVIVAMILFHDQVQGSVGATWRYVFVYLTPVVALAIAFLMVSRIPYRRFHRTYLVGRKPFSQVIMILLLVAVFALLKAPALLLLGLWYAATGPFFLLVRSMRGKDVGDTEQSALATPEEDRKHA